MTKFIVIKNWLQHQHYKDRNPPWIKLKRKLLFSDLWAENSDETRVLAIAIMLLASDTDNKTKLDPKYIKRIAFLNSDPNFHPLVDLDFIEIIDENDELASDLHTNAIPETEKRQRHIKKDFSKSKEKESKRAKSENGKGYYGEPNSKQLKVWDEYRIKTEGKGYPRDKNGGWYLPREWPPNYPEADLIQS